MSDIDINNIRRLDGGLLLVFRELMRQRRTTAAARRLGLSQSAVSHALARLRDLFDDPLFIRRAHGLSPTQRALELAPRVDALIDLASTAVRHKSLFDPASSERRFHLATTEYFASMIGAPLVGRLRKSAPRISFSADFLLETRALDALSRGEVDLAIGRFAGAPTDIVVDLLYEDRYCVVARRDHPEFRGRIGSAAYRKSGHIFSGTASTVSSAEPIPDAREIATHAVVPTWLTALMIASASDAIVTCPRRLAKCHAKTLGLQILKTPFAMNPIRISVARRTADDDPGVDWFLEQIRQALR